MKIPRASIWPTVSFDTTEADGMAAAEAWVWSVATDDPLPGPESDAEPIEAPTDHPSPETATEGRAGDRATYGPRHGDRWCVRDGKAVVVGSNDWPPPKPGTHESDLCDEGALCCQWCAADRDYKPPLADDVAAEFSAAARWSLEAMETAP